MRGGWTAVLAALAGACVGAPPPAPNAGMDGTGESEDTGSTSTTGGPGVSVGPLTTALPTSGEPDDTTDTRPVWPQLVLSDGPLYDFGDVDVGEQGQQLFAVTNVGTGAATGLAGVDLLAPFAYVGGSYPGDGGDCGDSLGPGEVCLLTVELVPASYGPVQALLQVVHDDGDAGVELVGRGVGISDNLLINPGGERQGTPPPGWSNTGVGVWVAGSSAEVVAMEDSATIYANEGPSGVEYVLEQVVEIPEEWLGLAEVGELRLSFVGFSRSRIGSDEHRIRVEVRGARADVLDEHDSGWSTVPLWEELAFSSLAPGGARELVVELYCRKTAGALCSAFYDALELRLEYP